MYTATSYLQKSTTCNTQDSLMQRSIVRMRPSYMQQPSFRKLLVATFVHYNFLFVYLKGNIILKLVCSGVA